MVKGSVGSGAAYLQLRVPETGISQAMQYWGGIKAKENAAQKLQDERAEQERKKQLEKYNVNIEDFNIKDGGYSDLNSANVDLSKKMLRMYSDLMYDSKQAYLIGDEKTADKLFNQANQVRSQFGNFQTTMDTFKKNFENYQKDFTDGKVSGWSKGFGNFFKGTLLNGKFKFGVTPNLEILRQVEFQDDNGNLKTQTVLDKNINNGNFRYFLKQDINKLTSDIAKDLGDTIVQSVDGYTNRKRVLWDEGSSGEGKHTKVAKDLLMAKLNGDSFMADMIHQYNLYKEFDIDEDNPPAEPEFTDEQRNVVLGKLMDDVKGKYKETIEDRFNYQKYSADVRASSGKSKDDVAASQLKYDVTRAIKDGDYTVLKRRFKPSKNSPEVSVTDVIKSPDGNSLTLVMSDGEEPVTIANSELGITEFVLRNSPEYNKITPQNVISSDPLRYRDGSIKASNTGAAISQYFDDDGTFKVSKSKQLIQRLKQLGYNPKLEGDWTWYDPRTYRDGILKIGNKSIPLNSYTSLEELSKIIDNVPNNTQKTNQNINNTREKLEWQ